MNLFEKISPWRLLRDCVIGRSWVTCLSVCTSPHSHNRFSSGSLPPPSLFQRPVSQHKLCPHTRKRMNAILSCWLITSFPINIVYDKAAVISLYTWHLDDFERITSSCVFFIASIIPPYNRSFITLLVGVLSLAQNLIQISVDRHVRNTYYTFFLKTFVA